jgi:hypothetical protein
MKTRAFRAAGLVLLTAAALAIGGCRPAPTGEAALLRYWENHPSSPLDYVVDKFSTHDWVFLGEYHRVKHDVDLVAALIPALHERTDVRVLAWEFLEHGAAARANELITAPEYDREAMVAFFRGQFPSWSYEEYLNIYRAAWESNRRFAGAKGPFLMVGLHPGIRWDMVNYGTEAEAAAELDKQRRYDELMARWLEEDVLSRGRKALVYSGVAHATAKYEEYYVDQPGRQLVRMGNLVYREPYAGGMFFIALHAPFYDSGTRADIYPFDGALDRLMKTYGRDIGFDVVGTPFAELTHAARAEFSITAHPFGALFDGYAIFKAPIKSYVGISCVPDWIVTEADFEQFWRNLSNKEASRRFSEIPFEDFKATFCGDNPDYGEGFSRRFRRLPDID